MKILAIAGSPRMKGNSTYLANVALAEAKRLGAETEIIVLNQYKINPCQGHDDCGSFDTCVQKDDAPWILDKVCQADGVIIATPVYYYNVSVPEPTGLTKQLLDAADIKLPEVLPARKVHVATRKNLVSERS